jgi:predicted metal-dependent HD superfamily phosphohydrolase
MPESLRSLIPPAEQYVANIFSEKIGKDFPYHSFQHTREVVAHCELIASRYDLDETDFTALMIAAWFHDTGYSVSGKHGHEAESQRIVTDFLQQRQAPQELIDKVNGCIRATKMPQAPSTLIEQIICDADLFHLGSDDFQQKNKLLREEVNNFNAEKIGKKDWRKLNVEFVTRHQFFTEFGREMLEPVKQKNLRELEEKAGLYKKEISIPKAVPGPVPPPVPQHTRNVIEQPEGAEAKKGKAAKTERGVVAMFRIMSESHNNLSQMADSKANIMISVNTIVISIMVSVLLGKLQFYPEFIIPTIILVGVCLTAVIFAILATRPNISGGTFTREDIQNKKINLLFFGNFYNMQLPDYDWAMKEMMKDKDYLYGSMIKDIYFLGVVLSRKYKFLRWSYSVFMYGLIAAIVAFAIAFIFSSE